MDIDIYGYLWISMDICGYLWISVDIYGYLWISVDICGYLWISMDILFEHLPGGGVQTFEHLLKEGVHTVRVNGV